MNGGRFDFDDGGTYCGGWDQGKAHGHGVCTGPRGQGEYAGAWHYGFEVSGIYIWPSGSTFMGQWQNGKRHGLGVEQRGNWVFKGEWTQGLKGRYGRREVALNPNAYYAGTWSSGVMDGYGTEKYSDGGTYEGQWYKGMRHGYGIRTSAPYDQAAKHRPRSSNNTHASLTSLRSNFGASMSIDEGEEIQANCIGGDKTRRSKSKDRRMDEQDSQASRSGFALKAYVSNRRRKRSLSERSLAVKRTILSGLRIRKQHSTDDIHHRMATSGALSVRSSGSTLSFTSEEDDRGQKNQQQLLDPIEPTAIEVYKGEWRTDSRTGFGICERSDGLRYIGEWQENKRHGYGVTFFKDGTREEGRYKNNELISATRRKGLLFLRSARLRENVDSVIEQARRAADLAKQRVEIARSRTMTAQEKAESSIEVAGRSKDDADTARICAMQFDPSFKQPGIEHLRQFKQRNTTPTSILLQNHIIAAANHIGYDQHGSASSNSPHYQQHYPLPLDTVIEMATPYHQNHEPSTSSPRHRPEYQHTNPLLIQSSAEDDQHVYDQYSGQNRKQQFGSYQNLQADSARKDQQSLQNYSLLPNNVKGHIQTDRPDPIQTESPRIKKSDGYISDGNIPNSRQPEQPVISNQVQTRAKQGRSNITRSGFSQGGDGSPSAHSISDDHFDQYINIRRTADGAGMFPSSSTDNRGLIRRNRPSLMRQNEVAGSGTPSPDVHANAHAKFLSDSPFVIQRRSTLARLNALGTSRSALVHSVYGADDSSRLDLSLMPCADGKERGSLPNLDELAAQELYIKREEAAKLASERRIAEQQRLKDAELLRANPLRYLFHSSFRDRLFRWRIPLLLIFGNILLFYYLLYLLTASKGNKYVDNNEE